MSAAAAEQSGHVHPDIRMQACAPFPKHDRDDAAPKPPAPELPEPYDEP
jgi:hypothetical protein